MLNLYTSKPHRFRREEIDLLVTVANEAAIVIENARLLAESKIIREELETHKFVERAKGVLMKEEKLSEEDAYRWIQKFAMDNRRSMREVAEAIILTHEMRTG